MSERAEDLSKKDNANKDSISNTTMIKPDDSKQTDGKAGKHDKEVSNCHLVSTAVVLAIFTIVKISVFHPPDG